MFVFMFVFVFLSFLMTKLTWNNIWGYEKGDPWCLCLCLFLSFYLFLMTKMTWDNIWGYEKGDPRHDDKKTGGEVIRDDVGHHVPLKSLQNLVFDYSLLFTLSAQRNK